jgi:hypothetical protein
MTTHGKSYLNGQKSPTYRVWIGMKARCFNPTTSHYEYYGGRGIRVCERWLSFENFLTDMGERPHGKMIDRYPNNDGNYEPGNCRWATRSENCRNKSDNRLITHQGQTKTMAEWVEITGLPRTTIKDRLAAGWDATRTLETPRKILRWLGPVVCNGQSKSVTAWCRETGVKPKLARAMLSQGIPPEVALFP